MTRWGLVALLVILAVGTLGVFFARVFGASSSRASALVRVASQWVAAWVLWTFLGALALKSGVLATYEPAIFGVIALAGGWLQYRTLVQGAPDRARAIFVGVQLTWLVVLAVQNRLF
jgi:hypothetical protein